MLPLTSCAPAGKHRKLKSPWLRGSSTQQLLKHQCVTNIFLTLNQNHSTVSATGNKIDTIADETGTGGKLMAGWHRFYPHVLWIHLIPFKLSPSKEYLAELKERCKAWRSHGKKGRSSCAWRWEGSYCCASWRAASSFPSSCLSCDCQLGLSHDTALEGSWGNMGSEM